MADTRFYLAQEGHPVIGVYPISFNGGKSTSCINMGNFSHVSFILACGAHVGNAMTIIVEECTGANGAGNNPIAFDVYKAETADTDVLGARVPTLSTGFSTSANNDVYYVIEIDSTQLDPGYPYVRVSASDPSGAQLASVIAICSGSRLAGDKSPTAIT